MKKHQCLYVALRVVLLVGWASACSSQTSIIEQPDICSPPCWHGIYVGQTTKVDALAQLTNAIDVDVNTLKEDEMPQDHWSAISWRFSSEVASSLGVISFYDNIATAIEFRTYEDLTVGETVDALGSPEFVAANFQCVPTDVIIARIINLTKGTMIESVTHYFSFFAPISRPKDFEINRSDAVSNVYYFDPSKVEQLAEEGVFTIVERFAFDDLPSNSLQPWPGFDEPISYIDLCSE